MDTAADKDNFLQLIEANKGIIIKICNSYCKNNHDREDLAQEIIYHLWKSGKSFNPDYKFSTWMYRVALNVAISFYRKEKRATPILSINELHINIEDAPPINEDKEKNIQLLQLFISQLKELDKALILLSFESKSYKEISEILGISETNVATRISRIKDRLKQQFANHQK
ncbi:MAG: RNA polymerase sigma factor [Ferruginibacter sp.]